MAPPRIIAGKYKGIRLQSIPGTITRPITDRVKEALFNIIGADILDSRFLDLFAGTGSVGIEALSRGAKYAAFIEKNTVPYKALANNLSIVNEQKRFDLIRGDAFNFIKDYREDAFDYIFIAPPQYKGIWKEILTALDTRPHLMSPNAWIMAQIDPIEHEEIELINLRKFDQRDYGSTRLVFYINP